MFIGGWRYTDNLVGNQKCIQKYFHQKENKGAVRVRSIFFSQFSRKLQRRKFDSRCQLSEQLHRHPLLTSQSPLFDTFPAKVHICLISDFTKTFLTHFHNSKGSYLSLVVLSDFFSNNFLSQYFLFLLSLFLLLEFLKCKSNVKYKSICLPKDPRF